MKTLYSTLFGLLLTISLSAQISITSADMPLSGDTLRYSIGDLDTLTLSLYQQTGANFTWDFSHLVPTSQDMNEYKASSSTSYAFFFLGANKYGLKVIDTLSLAGQGTISNVYDFYKNSSTAFEAEGRGLTLQGFPVPAFYSDKDEIYQFPLDYSDRDSSTFDFTTTIPFIGSLTTTGYRINDVDGYGTVMTPYDTIACLRVVTDVVSQDSINISALGGFAFPNHTRTYKWLANGEAFPMVEVSGNVLFGTFTPTEVRYRDVYRGLETVSPLAPTADFTANNLFPEATMDTVTFTPLVLPLLNTYTWGISPNTFDYVNGTNNTSQSPEVVFNAPGSYNVYMYTGNPFGNDDTTKLNYINVSTVSTTNLTIENALNVFPNPVLNGQVNVGFNLKKSADVEITLMDVQGRIVKVLKSENLSTGTYQETLKIGNELKGIYFLNVKLGTEQQSFRLLLN